MADETVENGNMINSMMIITEVVMAAADMDVVIANDTIRTDLTIITIDQDHMIDAIVGQKVEVGEMLIG